MEAGTQQRRRARDQGSPGAVSEDLRDLLAAAVTDVCKSLRVPLCSLSRLHGEEAIVAAVCGAASDSGASPGSRWQIMTVPLAHQAVVTGRAVIVTSPDDPRLTPQQRQMLVGASGLTCIVLVPLLGRSTTTALLVLGDRRPRDLGSLLPQLSTLGKLTAVVLEQDDRLEQATRSADDLALVLDADIEAHNGSSKPDHILRVVARRLAELCHAPAVDIHAVDAEQLRARVVWQHGRFCAEQEGSVTALSDWPLARTVVESGRPEAVSSRDDPRLTPCQRERLESRSSQSLLAIPLLNRGRVVGLAQVFDTAPRDFSEVSQSVRSLAEVAAHLMAKAELLETLEQRNHTLREIVALGAHVNDTSDPEQMAGLVARRLLDVMGATCCEIFKIERGQMRCLVSLDTRPGFDDPDAGEPVELTDYPSLGRAAQAHELLVFASTDDPRLTDDERQVFARWGFASELSIPLLIEDRLVGMIDIFDVRARDYTESLDLARSTGQLVAGAFDNLLLLERLAESNRELLQLADSSLEFGASLELDDVLDSVASRMCVAAEATRCAIFAIDGSDLSGLVSSDGADVDRTFPGTACSLADYAISRHAIDLGQPITVTQKGGATSESPAQPPGLQSFRALLALPLINRREVVGVACIFDRARHEFPRVDLLRGLGQIAAQAIANARVHEALDAGTTRLKQISDAGLELSSSLDLGVVLDGTARRLCTVAGVEGCDIYTLHHRVLHCKASIVAAQVDKAWLRRRVGLDDWRAARLAVDSRTVVTVSAPDDRHLTFDEPPESTDQRHKSGLIVPLVVENRAIGVIDLFQTIGERVFAEEEVATIEAVCRVAALAISNAELFRDAELRSRESELLNRIATKASSSLDSGQIAAATVEELALLVPFEEACLLMVTESPRWEVAYTSSPAFPAKNGEDEHLPKALLQRLLSEPVVCADPEESLLRTNADSGVAQPCTLLLIGIHIDEVLVGALVLATPTGSVFAHVDRHLLTRVGALLALSFKNARLYETIKTMHVSNLKALVSALNARDSYAVGHAARVAGYTLLLGRELGWPPDKLQQITEAAFLHDVGRIGVSDEVLYKPGRLSAEETAELRRHPVASAEIIRPLFTADIVDAVRHHHERWDGTGYPDRLAGEHIPEVARALCVVDSYDAMSFQRPHHEALSYAECLAELERCRSTHFDPQLVTVFMRVLDRLDERRTVAREAAETAAARIDPTALTALSLLGDETRPAFVRMAETLREVRDVSPGVRFLTTMVAGHYGWQTVCDPEEDPVFRTHLGDPVDRSAVGDEPFDAESHRNALRLDDLGLWVSGLADVRDRSGSLVGGVCADMPPADDWPAELGASAPFHDRTLSAIIESATARLGRARVDAVTDGLTGLYNQRYFKQRLGEEVARATEQGRPLSLLFCDLDHFKGYNDRLGHLAGDTALRAVAGVILHSIRQVDLAARYGGEELTVILIDTPAAAAAEVAERIRTSVFDLKLGGPERSLTVSIGCSTFPKDATLMEELVDKSDWAMYLAKRQGRNRVTPFRSDATDDPCT